ncbi:hypothetical protein pb186bvf_002975 [Paramecium bursaria]
MKANVGQQIFQSEQPPANNDQMMQNMMKFFQAQMQQMMNGQQGLQDLEKFYANKVQDMNQFYNQISTEDKYLQQSSQFVQRPSIDYNPNKYLEPPANDPITNRKLNFDQDIGYYNEFQDVSEIQEPIIVNPYRQKNEDRSDKKQQQQEKKQKKSPIKQKYQVQEDERPIKPAKYESQEDERPIRPQKQTSLDEYKPQQQNYPQTHSFDDIPIKPEDDDPIFSNPKQKSTKVAPPRNQYDDERPIKGAQPSQRIFEDDRPIKGAIEDERPIKGVQQKIFEDERPIKGAQQKIFEDDRPIRSQRQEDEIPIKSQKQYNPIFEDDRPLKGADKQIFQQQQDNMRANRNNQDENDGDDKPKSKKTFLKKGTRQYLSNAQVRSDIAKKEQQDIMKENNAAAVQMQSKQTQSRPKLEVQKYTETYLYEKPQPKKQQPKHESKISQSKVEKIEKVEQKFVDIPKKATKKEPEMKKPIEEEYQFDDQDDWNDEPKQSKITQQYFPGKEKQQKQQVSTQPIDLTQEQEEEIVRKYVSDKINALNEKLQKVQAENDKVRKSKIKYDDQFRQLQREREEWEKQKINEKQELELFIEEEKKKILREKRVQERQIKTFQNVPNRKEREEFEQMKKQVLQLQEDIKAKDQKHKLNYDRMKKQYEDMVQRNQELQNEVKALELKIIEQKQGPAPPGNPQVFQNKSNINQTKSAVIIKNPKETNQSAKKQQPIQQNIQSNVYKQSSSEEEDNSDDFDEDQENHDDYEDIKLKSDKKINKNIKILPIQQQQQQQQKQSQSQVQTKKYDLIELQEQEIQFSIRLINKIINESEFSYDHNKFYMQYKKSRDQQSKVVNQNVGPDGKVQRVYANGKKEVIFHNGVKREVFPDGYTIVHFTNNDIKQTLPNGTIIYYFADAQTTQITVSNGPNVYRFANQQIEIHLQDGSKEIRFGDGTEKYISPSGEEETLFSDGIHQKIDSSKTKYIEYPNGNVDVVYPDGQKVRRFRN